MADQSDRDDGALSDDDRLHRATIEFGLYAEQAERFELVVAAAARRSRRPDRGGRRTRRFGRSPRPPGRAGATTDLLGPPLDALVASLVRRDDPNAGIVWLGARHDAWHGRTDEALQRLTAAAHGEHRLVLVELAAIEADRSSPLTARELLRRAGSTSTSTSMRSTTHAPRTPGSLPSSRRRSRPSPRCGHRRWPDGTSAARAGPPRSTSTATSGSELHPIVDRAGWLYVKLMRYLQVNHPLLPGVIADDIVEAVTDPDLRAMVHESYLGIDLALFEGGIAQRFLDAKRTLLPADEAELLQSWIDATRSVLDVVRSRPGSMEVVDLATRERSTVVDTVPDEPLDVGWKIIGRLVPVGDAHRAYGGFLPVNDDMVTAMLEAFATRRLGTVVLAIGQIFDTATTQDEIQNLFAESLDTGELERAARTAGRCERRRGRRAGRLTAQGFFWSSSAVTALPSACPRDAFITAPTSASIALPSPPQNFAQASGCSAIAASTIASSSEVSIASKPSAAAIASGSRS